MAANKRLKSEGNKKSITDWHDADEAVKVIRNGQVLIDSLTAEATKSIDKIKTDLAAKTTDLRAGIDYYVRGLEDFCEIRKAEFGDARSKKLTFGTVGWRKSCSVVVKKTVETLALLKKILGRESAAYIRIKEEPNKEAMAILTDEQLASVGARRKVKDDFYVEPYFVETKDS